jgi:hypothetical protein
MRLLNDIQQKMLNTGYRMTYLFVFVVSASFIVSCDDDDDNGFPSVAGSWTGDKTELVITVEGFPTPINETDDSFSGEVEFRNNGTAVYKEDGEEKTGTWSQANDKLLLSIPDEDEEIDMSGTYTIKEINAKRLKIYIEKEQAFEDEDSGMTFDANIKATLSFDRK